MASLLLLVRLDLKLGKCPLKTSTYSGMSLVSWLEWKGKTVKDIYIRQDVCGTTTREVRLKDRRMLIGAEQTSKVTHKNTYATEFCSQLLLSECELYVSMAVWWSAGCGPAFTPLSIRVKSCKNKIWSHMLDVFSGSSHINIFVYANLEAHSYQPFRWMEE